MSLYCFISYFLTYQNTFPSRVNLILVDNLFANKMFKKSTLFQILTHITPFMISSY